MATGTLTVASIKGKGTTATLAAATATDGDSFINDGIATFLLIKNAGATSVTATIKAATSAPAGYDDDMDVTVAAGAQVLVGKFPTQRFGATPVVVCSTATDVTLGAFKIA